MSESEKTIPASFYWAALLTLGAALVHFAGLLGELPQSRWLSLLLLAGAAIQAFVAVAAVFAPGRGAFAAAALVESAAVLLWLAVRTVGLPLPGATWRPETLGVPDYYLPAMQAISAIFFACLYARTRWAGSKVLRAVPLALVASLLVWGLATSVATPSVVEIAFVNFFMIADFPTSLLAPGLLVLFLLLCLAIRPLGRGSAHVGINGLALLPALLLASPLTSAAAGIAATRGWLSGAAEIAVPAGATMSLSYCSAAGGPLAMDLSEPRAAARRPAPAVIYVHGGAGFLGSRKYPADQEGHYFSELRDDLVSQGMVVGAIDYPFIPMNSLAGMVDNTRCAIRFVRAHASELGVDPNRVGIYGDSEGGYMAAMLGTTGSVASSNNAQYADQSSRVEAVVDMWGFTDLTDFSGSPSWIKAIGSSSHGSHAAALSPLYLVKPGDPPFLIIHGVDDWFIAPHHSEKLAQRLAAAGVPETLVLVQHGGHGLAAATAGTVQQPSAAVLVRTISQFFAKALAA